MIILSTDSIILWILLPNKCSSLFFAIHLPPVEEGEFLLYIMLNESKSADGSWTTDIVHSIFFTNRKYLFQISRKKRNDPFYSLFTQLFYKCNFIF